MSNSASGMQANTSAIDSLCEYKFDIVRLWTLTRNVKTVRMVRGLHAKVRTQSADFHGLVECNELLLVLIVHMLDDVQQLRCTMATCGTYEHLLPLHLQRRDGRRYVRRLRGSCTALAAATGGSLSKAWKLSVATGYPCSRSIGPVSRRLSICRERQKCRSPNRTQRTQAYV